MKINGLKDISPVKGVQALVLREAEIPLPEILKDNLDDAEYFFSRHSGVIPFKDGAGLPQDPVLIVFDEPDRLYEFLLKAYYGGEPQAASDIRRIFKICREKNLTDDRAPAEPRALFGHLLRSAVKSGAAEPGNLFSLPLMYRGAITAGLSQVQGLLFPRNGAVKMAVIRNLISGSRRMVWQENGRLQALIVGSAGQLEFRELGGEELTEIESQHSYFDIFLPSNQQPLKIDLPGGSIFKPIAMIRYREVGFRQARPDFPDSADKFIQGLNKCLLVPDDLIKLSQGSYSAGGRVVRKFYGIKPAERLLIKTRGRLYDAGAMESTVDMNGIYSKAEFGDCIWLADLNDPLTGQPVIKR